MSDMGGDSNHRTESDLVGDGVVGETTVDKALIAAVQSRLVEVTERISAAGADPAAVTIVAVTKTFPLDRPAAAVAVGLVDVGENYGQELEQKYNESAHWSVRPRWHFVGGLQRNKVKRLAGKVHLWHNIDRESLVDELARRDPGTSLLVQVNTTGEDQKSGCHPDEVGRLVDRARTAGLDVAGLMTLGPTGGGDPMPAFERLRRLGDDHDLEQLSMGMSGDYEKAVAAGSTMLRLGTALFGPRQPR